MCGINGFLTRQTMTAESLRTIAESMSREQLHRGPDDSGVWADEVAGVSFGFRRLAILDLSSAGHQPMHSADGRYVVVFNGEIYNFAEIRGAIEKDGSVQHWRGHSDTEVLLAAIVRWGIKGTLRRTNGMFALAVWDREEKSIYLARDRVGEKPLYYGWCGSTFLFGSELHALRVHPEWKGEINRRVLALYMRYNYIPTPFSIYTGIYKLPPATILTLPWRDGSAGAPALSEYWSARDTAMAGAATPVDVSPEEAVSMLDSHLRGAVGLRMVADVPIGAFLSGGVDSSAIVAIMQALSSRPVHTFSIGFSERGYDEASQAKLVAAHLGTDHTELYVSDAQARQVIPRLPRMYSEPFADSSQIPTFLVSALARQDVTVALSGDGGDELFGGYNRYLWGRSVLSSSFVPRGIRSLVAGALTGVAPGTWDRVYRWTSRALPAAAHISHPGDSLHKLARVMTTDSGAALYERLTTQWEQTSQFVVGAGESLPVTPNWLSNGGPAFADPVSQMMYLDLVTYLPDDILVKVDRASMAESLEARVPYLDHNVIAFAWSLPNQYKFRNGQGKWILRKLLRSYVPPSLTERPKKGFGVPLDAWLRGPLKEWAAALLDESRLVREGFLEPDLVRVIWREHLSGRYNRQQMLWGILMFQSWLESEHSGAH